MFLGCTKLTTAPELPAESLASYCYKSMFCGCKALATAPDLPAKSLADNCYNEMFSYCTSLTNLPELPDYFEFLATSCFKGMFQNCTALKTAPELTAYQLGEYCYQNMFYGCTSLETAPMIHVVRSLAADCFAGMFSGCTKLSSVKLFIESDIKDNFNPHFYLSNWLNGAGTKADSPQLYLGGGIHFYYNNHCNDCTNESLFPENWHVQSL